MVEKFLNHPAPDFAMYLADAFIFSLCRKSQGTHGFCFLWGGRNAGLEKYPRFACHAQM